MKLSGHFLFLFFLASSSVFTQAVAEELPKGNETGNRLGPAEALTKMINEEEVYKIDKEHESCPPFIQLKKTDPKYYATEKKIEKDDIFFELDGYKENNNKIAYDYFTHENTHFQFKPKLKGKSRNLSEGCSFVVGVACRSDYQITTKDSVEFEGRARVFSLVMIGSVNSLVQINSEKNTVTYTLKANSIDDIVCNYKAAPVELKSKILSYNAQRAAEKIASEEAWSKKINNTNRSAVKEVEQRSPAENSSANKTQSK